MSHKSQTIIQRLTERIKGVDFDFSDKETGIVYSVGDGIVFARGLGDVQANELVRFADGTMGIALNLEENQVGIILLGSDKNIKENDYVYRTGEIMSTPVGDGLLGRVVDATGTALDGKAPIEASEYYQIERPAPSVIDRKSVDRPLYTGIKIIDAMVPIGKGQRELIIGDRQTGKTSIAINAIINQKNTGVKCVYVAIGQKNSTVAQTVQTLEEYGAMDYTVVVNASADSSSAQQYIAPYTGCSIGEYWMERGEDVLIVYDDLSKHAVAYRAISLLLRRPSGREAYPGDVFYLHSRLLERAGQLNDEKGGGSMTALPIVETQLGDISGYIPTNVISITDGQLFLDADDFLAGRRPAIDSGLSVSRVGSSAQTPAMKHVSSSLRLELANYYELLDFAQYSSDIDPETQAVIDHGGRVSQLLRQSATRVISHDLMILSLFLNRYGYLDKLEFGEVLDFEKYMHKAFESDYPQILEKIKAEYKLDDDLIEEIKIAMDQILKDFQVISHGK